MKIAISLSITLLVALTTNAFAANKAAFICKATEIGSGMDGDVPNFQALKLTNAVAQSSSTGKSRTLAVEEKQGIFSVKTAQSDDIITLNFTNQSGESLAAQRAPHENSVTVYSYSNSGNTTASGTDDASLTMTSPRMTVLSCVSTLSAVK